MNETATADDQRASLLPIAMGGAALALTVAVTAARADEQTVWYVIRASGVIAYLLLTATVAGGLVRTGRLLPPGRLRVDQFQIHNFTALLVISFATLHAVMLLFDEYVGFAPKEVVVPFTSDYRPLSVGLGVVTLYLTLVLYGSFWVRGRIGKPAWRVVHYSSFIAFVFATYHGIFTGTDSGSVWMIVLYGTSFGLVALLLLYRVIIATGEVEDVDYVVAQAKAASSAGDSTGSEARDGAAGSLRAREIIGRKH